MMWKLILDSLCMLSFDLGHILQPRLLSVLEIDGTVKARLERLRPVYQWYAFFGFLSCAGSQAKINCIFKILDDTSIRMEFQ